MSFYFAKYVYFYKNGLMLCTLFCNWLFHLTIYCELFPRPCMVFCIIFTGFLFCCMTKSWLIYLIAYCKIWLFSSLHSYKQPFTESCVHRNFSWNKFLEVDLLGYQITQTVRFLLMCGFTLECVLPRWCCYFTDGMRPWIRSFST